MLVTIASIAAKPKKNPAITEHNLSFQTSEKIPEIAIVFFQFIP